MLLIQSYIWFPYLAKLELEISLVIRDASCYLILYNGRNYLLRDIQTKPIVYVMVSEPKHSN
jgi:hypothetical protein